MLEVLSCCQVNSLVSILLITLLHVRARSWHHSGNSCFLCCWRKCPECVLNRDCSGARGCFSTLCCNFVFPWLHSPLLLLDFHGNFSHFGAFPRKKSLSDVVTEVMLAAHGAFLSVPSHVTLMYECTASRSQSNWPTITTCSRDLNKKGGWQGGLLELHKQGGTVGKRQC